MNDLGRLGYLSYLDLICCGFGSALLMFFIVISAAAGSRLEEANAALIVRCHYESGRQAEVGIEFQPPGSDRWQHDISGQTEWGVMFSASSEPNSGGDALLVLANPQPGLWLFRPYLVNYSKSKTTTELLKVRLELVGEHCMDSAPATTISSLKIGRAHV